MGDGAPDARLRDHFIGWQCRVRQHAMREYGGRPSPGMRPRVLTPDGAAVAQAITVVLMEAEPAASIARFRHIVRKTHDPETRHGDGYAGRPDQAPFDGIIVTAAAKRIPPPLIEQLRPGGRLVVPVGRRWATQDLTLVEKSDAGKVTERRMLPVAFVPLTRKR